MRNEIQIKLTLEQAQTIHSVISKPTDDTVVKALSLWLESQINRAVTQAIEESDLRLNYRGKTIRGKSIE